MENNKTPRITSAELIEQCLCLLRTLHDATIPKDWNQQPLPSLKDSDNFMLPLLCQQEMFFSSRLRRKVKKFMDNPWSIIQIAENPLLTRIGDETDKNNIRMIRWCRMMMRKFPFFFPFSTRIDFWRATSLGLSR